MLQHKEFEEIEGRLQRREPLILGTPATQRLNRRLPVEVISDPLDDVEIDPYEDGSDAHKLRGHQVQSLNELWNFLSFSSCLGPLRNISTELTSLGFGVKTQTDRRKFGCWNVNPLLKL